jgi:hypothetical protein
VCSSDLDLSDGIPAAGIEVESENREPGECDVEVRYSECPSDLFTHRGVELDAGFPCSALRVDTAYPVSGRLHFGDTLQLATYDAERRWQYQCVDLARDGSFAVDLEFDADLYGVRTYIMLSASDDCDRWQGWDYSVNVSLLPR